MSKVYEENIQKADNFIRLAKEKGADLVLLPELFEGHYFCQIEDYDNFSLAEDFHDSKTLKHFQEIAKETHMVLPISFFEKAGNCYFNSLAMIDNDGKIVGLYRKSHIPTGECYEEKFYFTPGDTGFQVFSTHIGKIGVGICWDQWFPETARALALNGAELIFYPTAIGSEPILECDSMPHWRRCMQGHSAANVIPVIAANRIGREDVTPCDENGNQTSSLVFYGSSFITNETGEIIKSASRDEETVLTAEFDLDEVFQNRLGWGIFRDRRPDCYKVITEK